MLTLPITGCTFALLFSKEYKVLFFAKDCFLEETGEIRCIMLRRRFLSEMALYWISIK